MYLIFSRPLPISDDNIEVEVGPIRDIRYCRDEHGQKAFIKANAGEGEVVVAEFKRNLLAWSLQPPWHTDARSPRYFTEVEVKARLPRGHHSG